MKSKKNLLVLVVLAAAVLMAAGSMAEETEEAPDYSKMKGKDLYKSLCKSCHMEDSEAGEYTPMTLIMEQWEEFFDGDFTETHKAVACPKDETKMVPDAFDKDMIKKLKKFCVDHAADSEQPMTCG